MLLAFLDDISGRRRRRREWERAETLLLALLGREGRLGVDAALATRLGVGRKALMRAVYGLALREAAHMLSNAKNELLLMTNAEFGRFMTESGRDRKTGGTTAAASASAAGIPMTLDAAESGLFPGATLGGAPQCQGYDWFAIDVAPPEPENAAAGEAEKGGKILPERERDPWVGCAGVGLD